MNVINNETIALIKEYEGKVLTAYPDPATGNEPWTIGWGHTGRLAPPDVDPGDKIDLATAEAYLKADLEATGRAMEKYLKVQLNDNQYGALVSFFFNVGEGTFRKSSVLKFANDPTKWNSVPGRLALYRKAGRPLRVMAGLVRRRSAEGELWMKVISNTNNQVQIEIKETQGAKVEADTPRKPWDWGSAGTIVTLLATASDQVKKLIGNITTTFGVEPTVLLIIIGVGFAGWTIYSKWKEK